MSDKRQRERASENRMALEWLERVREGESLTIYQQRTILQWLVEDRDIGFPEALGSA